MALGYMLVGLWVARQNGFRRGERQDRFFRRVFPGAVVLAVAGKSAYVVSLYGSFMPAELILFYGYGFGYYGSVPPLIQVLIVLGFFVLQVQLSRLWLSRHPVGPLEWILRRFTYW